MAQCLVGARHRWRSPQHAGCHAHGFATREAYADARHGELLAALSVAGVTPDRVLSLGFIDQECSRQLPELVRRVAALARDIKPETVLAPPYEGGHPDHDSLAFAVHAACRLMVRQQGSAPRIVEHALYHSQDGQDGQLRTGEFLPFSRTHAVTIRLSDRAQMQKKQMLACFATQQSFLASFPTTHERFRDAPYYDFTAPPHEGILYYENFDWGVTGAQWRELAAAAARDLGEIES
jgi:LmbE family N-acetylglucosaminyl deacetylase